ncbi:glycosyltransferase family 9 protein [Sphingomonas suaedae]|uniref:Glycosyltransferase family 9 protein n=1 Tax=Sphingomonas suaedae TaxID=2599297 RepID=A0A518RJ30_9SPHN|nr:glycosyltransferase family 9 protein [Sphingomonas suaedae]QDX27465.1 glycosyltransferase family 9 protein [Sphingomonas suaedae]
MSQRIGIMVHHGLGDVISALPAIHAVDRLIGPGGRLEIVVKSRLEAGLFEAVDWQAAKHTHILSGGSKWRRLLRMLHVAWALRRARLDIFVMPHMTSERFARLLGGLVGARRTVVPGNEAMTPGGAVLPRPGEHKAELFARFFTTADLPIAQDELRFPDLSATESVQDGTARRIVLAPAVGTKIEQHKAWPETAFARLAEQIADRWPDAAIELFAAPPERAVLDRVFAEISPERRGRVTLSTPATPALAASSLSGVACVVTACSGASHLAAWADAPIVGLYGPTNPGFTGPFSRRLYPVRLGWACSPCYRPGFVSGCAAPGCMTGITVDMACAAVAAALDDAPTPSCRGLRTTDAVAPDRRVS